ncbi:MAG TPA: hypothetical protein VM240_09720 [Verrucomicrobiae bacterium]|nr:hypothetical protein [Verrucomicrobiae bacterium]
MNNFPFAWYYVGVLALLLIGQQVLMSASHKDATTKLTAQYEQKLKAACPVPVDTASATPEAPPPPVAASPAATAPVAEQAKPAAPEKSQASPKAPFETSPKSEMIIASAPAARAAHAAPAPLTVAFRTEPLTQDKIVLLTNTSAKARNCRVTVKRATGGDGDAFDVLLSPGKETHVHGSSAWEFRKGDRLRMVMAGFAPKVAAVE